MAVFVSQNQQRRERKSDWTGHFANANIATSPALERREKFKETKSKKCGKEDARNRQSCRR
jgi:hypothetical protein